MQFFFIKKCNFFYPYAYKLEKFSALKREHLHLALQNMKFLYIFFESVWPSWIRIRNPNPEPLTSLNPDPGLKHWFTVYKIKFCTSYRYFPFMRIFKIFICLHVETVTCKRFFLRCLLL